MSNYRASDTDNREDSVNSYARDDREDGHGTDDREVKDGVWNKTVSDNAIQPERFKTFEKVTTVNKSTQEEMKEDYCRKRPGEFLDQMKWATQYDKALPSSLLGKCKPEICGVCSIPFSSQIVSKAHYVGKKHEKNFRHELEKMFKDNSKNAPKRKKNESLYCSLCDIHSNSATVYQSHVVGKQHVKKLSSGQVKNQANNNSISCEVCNIFVSSDDTLKSHELGKRHRKKLQMTEVDQTGFSCDVCRITARDHFCLEMHLQGSEHRANARPIPQENGGGGQQAIKGSPPQFSCSLCNMSSRDQFGFNLHLQSKGHQAKAGALDSNRVQDIS